MDTNFLKLNQVSRNLYIDLHKKSGVCLPHGFVWCDFKRPVCPLLGHAGFLKAFRRCLTF